MTGAREVYERLAGRQHRVAAVWQMKAIGVRREAIDHWVRHDRPPRIHRGVYGDADGWGRYMAAVLAVGRGAAISHLAALRLWGMRPREDDEAIEVSAPGPGGRQKRAGFVVHRRSGIARTRCLRIPVTTPAQSLLDARLPRHEAYRALEAAEALRLPVDRSGLTTPSLREVRDVLRLGMNPTRSDAEARFIFLCRDHGIEMPVVNHTLHGFEADFHWPRAHLVVEVDGWEFHDDRVQFERDRARGLAHRIGGYEVVRVSALQVAHDAATVVAALLAAAPSLAYRS